MAYIGMIYHPVPAQRPQGADPAGPCPAWQARYGAQVQPRAALAVPLRRQGAQVGMGQAERWLALSAGGAGLEDFLRHHFPRVEAVLWDFYPVTEYRGKLAQALHPGDEGGGGGVASAVVPPGEGRGGRRRVAGVARPGATGRARRAAWG